jgi:hypothetical protein
MMSAVARDRRMSAGAPMIDAAATLEERMNSRLLGIR